jgi:hypothetical protein
LVALILGANTGGGEFRHFCGSLRRPAERQYAIQWPKLDGGCKVARPMRLKFD